jgi:hypothetical protein
MPKEARPPLIGGAGPNSGGPTADGPNSDGPNSDGPNSDGPNSDGSTDRPGRSFCSAGSGPGVAGETLVGDATESAARHHEFGAASGSAGSASSGKELTAFGRRYGVPVLRYIFSLSRFAQ